MKAKFYILILLIINLLFSADLFSQLVTSSKVVNYGTIQIKKQTLNQTGGNIDNEKGKIITSGPNTFFTQDTIKGYMEYSLDDNGYIQLIPQIVYWDINFLGNRSQKLFKNFPIDTNLNLTSLKYFRSDSAVRLEYLTSHKIFALGYVEHKGDINVGQFFGRVSLIGRDSSQDITGFGNFKELELDNTKGADVIGGGGFSINTTLELKKGEFRNNDTNNFLMKDNSTIIRWSGASIATEPMRENFYSVRYEGDTAMETGPEIPLDTTVLADLTVNNVGGLNLNKNFTANRQITVNTQINTEQDTALPYVLTLTDTLNPKYGTANSEIIGSFRRTKLRYNNDTILYNNKYTYVLFPAQPDAGGAIEMTLRVRPRTFPPNADPNTKTLRDIYISAKDTAGMPVDTGLNFVLGYGWRHIMSDPIRHETNNLNVPDIILQRWDISIWRDYKTSLPPIEDPSGWGYSHATEIHHLGQFAIGISDIGQLALRAIVLMEGPYRYGTMANDLRMRNLIPNTPPDIYPYNLDPRRDSNYARTIDTNVVDWVLVEFYKDSLSIDSVHYRCALLLRDGSIVDIDGVSPLSIARGGMEEGNYWIGIRHRNHLAIYTDSIWAIFPSPEKPLLDLTKPENIYGGAAAFKPVGFDPSNSLLFGLVAGDVDGDGMVTDLDSAYTLRDDFQSWENRDKEGYLKWDVTLSGIIHTRDLNYAWNNRGRKELSPFK